MPDFDERPRFRLMPLTIGFLAFLFLAKAYDLYSGTHTLLAGEAQAKTDEGKSDSPEAAAAPPKAAAEAATKQPDATNATTEGAKPADTNATAAVVPPEGNATAAEAKPAEGNATAEAKEGEKPAETKKAEVAPKDFLAGKGQYSQVEVDLLQSLSARRQELDKWQSDIQMKENLLDATEKRLDRKAQEIQTMQASLKKLVDQYNQHQDTEIKSLVKIYENMKAKDAAAIFDQMEMPILVLIIDKMSERKAAPVLAAMDPVKAKNLTIELAAERKAHDDALNLQSASAAAAPPVAPAK